MQKGDWKIKEKRKGNTEEEEREKQKNCIDYQKNKPIVVLALPSIYVRVNLFIPKKLI